MSERTRRNGRGDEHGAAGLRRARPRACRNDRALRAVSRRSATRLFRERCRGTNRRDAGRGGGRLGGERRFGSTSRARGWRPIPGGLGIQGGLPAPHDRPGIYAAGERSPGTSWSCTRPRARPTSQRQTPPSEAPRSFPRRSVPWAASPNTKYASVGLSEATARGSHDVVVGTGRTSTPCSTRSSTVAQQDIQAGGTPAGDRTILGCHIVGERAVELAQAGGAPVAAAVKVEQLAWFPFFVAPPTPTRSDARRSSRAPARLWLGPGRRADGMGRRAIGVTTAFH